MSNFDSIYLNDTQLLMLDILIYAFDRDTPVEVGQQVWQIVNNVDSALKDRMIDGNKNFKDEYGEKMTYASWFAILDGIRRDEALATLVLENYKIDELFARNAVFTDNHNNAYFILAGTGKGEWHDNLVAAYQPDSQQQLRTLHWFEGAIADKNYKHVAVSGHSKGGNKCMYLAVVCGHNIDRAVSFDGQGFSREFLKKYSEKIDIYKSKITAFALSRDYINGFLNDIVPAENKHFVVSRNVEDFAAGHSPFEMLEQVEGTHNLKMRELGQKEHIVKVVEDFTAYMQNLPMETFVTVANFLACFLDRKITQPALYGKYPPSVTKEDQEEFRVTVNVIVEFFKEEKIEYSVHDVVEIFIPKYTNDDEEDDDVLAEVKQMARRVSGKLETVFDTTTYGEI